jgi:hypothetical protein
METTIQLTTSQILTYGAELRRTLETDSFKAAVQLQKDEYQRRFFTSGYGDEASREQAYRMNIALDDLLNSISAFVVQADQIRSEPNEENDD